MKILVPTDGSDYAMKAVNKAAEIAEKEKAEVTIMSVALYADLANIEYPGDIREMLDAEAQNAINKAKEIFDKKGIAVKTILERGISPADNIVRRAKEDKFDLIIMGHRGTGEFPGTGIGTTATKVVALTPCSVLIVK
ncbi:MAG: universal stress protein [Thermodesulfovibrio sp.]